jgi:hypothetical protein
MFYYILCKYDEKVYILLGLPNRHLIKNKMLKSLKYKKSVFTMSYIKKTCPVCGKEFFVLKNAEEKAIYCTLACLTRVQDKFGSRGMSFPDFG